MFDFSLTGILLAFATSLWASLSPAPAAALVVALVAGVLGTVSRSRASRAALIGLALTSGALAAAWQCEADNAARWAAAERMRTELADRIIRDLAEQATRDLAEAQADALHLKGLNDVLASDPRLRGVCLPRDIARRLRAL